MPVGRGNGGAATGGRALASGLLPRTEYAMLERALRHGWVIPAAARADVVEQLVQDCLTGPDVRSRAAAARALIAADGVNVRREANSIQARQGDIRAQAAAVRALSEAPEMRQLLAQLSAEYARQAPVSPLEGDDLPAPDHGQ